jgi:carbonic anhydrase
VKNITPALKHLDHKLPPERLLAPAVEANVRWSMGHILQSPEGRAQLAEGRVKLVGAIYQIKTGRVKFLK